MFEPIRLRFTTEQWHLNQIIHICESDRKNLKPMLRYQRRERHLLSKVEESLVPFIWQHSI